MSRVCHGENSIYITADVRRFYKRIVLIYFLLMIVCSPVEARQRLPVAENGILDLTSWNFDSLGPVGLAGEWKFLWMDAPENDSSSWELYSVPGSWDKKKYSVSGYCQLRLRVLVKPSDRLGLYLRLSQTAYTLSVNGKRVLENGTVGTDRNSSVPEEYPCSGALEKADTLHIVWKISNFHDLYDGGPQETPVLGIFSELNHKFWLKDIAGCLLMGILFMMGMYHILLWIGRRNDMASLYFALFCLAIFIRTIATEAYLERLFPKLFIFPLDTKITYGFQPLAALFFISFMAAIFPRQFPAVILRPFQCVAIFLSLWIFITNTWTFTPYLNHIQIFIVLSSIWVIASVTQALIKKEESAGIVLTGFILFFCIIINDILYSHSVIHTIYMLPAGLVIFIFFQSAVLSMRFARAFETAEHLSNNLQKEVLRTTAELMDQKKELEQVNLQQKYFFQNVTHEFRTPLTLLLGIVDSLLVKEHSDQDLIEKYTIMNRNARQLLRLINQLLDVARAESGALHLSLYSFDLILFLQNIVTCFQPLALKKNIRFSFNCPLSNLYIEADPEKIELAVFNLLANAFKFTDPGGKISVTVIMTDARHLEIQVADTGIGISQQDCEVIFKRFRQVDGSSTRSYGGTGIGLTLVKEYVELHKGNIRVSSDPGKGSTFIICLPLTPMSPDLFQSKKNQWTSFSRIDDHSRIYISDLEIDFKTENKTENTNNTASMHDKNTKIILIAEDNHDMRTYIRDILSGNYRVIEAENGLRALEKITLTKPDLIISDIMMPVMDGYQLLQALKKDERTNTIPIIMLTAKISDTLKIQQLEAGADDYLLKPFNSLELRARIKNLLIIREQTESLKTINRELAKLEDFKNTLSSTIIHDINNYLLPVTTTLLMLENQTLSKEKTQQFIILSQLACKNIADLASNLLDVRKIEESKISIHPIQFTYPEIIELISKIAATPAMVLKNIDFSLLPLPADLQSQFVLQADAYLLERVLYNLLNNAIKYTPDHGKISVTFEMIGTENRIILYNTSTPISEENMSVLFNKYNILDEKPSVYAKGIGLFFCKIVMDRHGGRIWVDTDSSGNYFTIAFKATEK